MQRWPYLAHLIILPIPCQQGPVINDYENGSDTIKCKAETSIVKMRDSECVQGGKRWF